jgi:outer membrane protein
MKKITAWSALPVFCVFLAFCDNLAAADQNQPDQWTARTAVDFALANSPDTTVMQLRLDQNQNLINLAKAAHYPIIILSSEYSYTNNPMYSFGNILNQGEFDNTIDFNDPGATDNLQAKAEIRYRIYNGGQDQAGERSAEAQVAQAAFRLQQIQQKLAYEVVRAYHSVIQAGDMVKVHQEALTAISAAVAVGKARFDAGDLLQQDLLNLELQEARASENLIRSRHELALSKRTFLNLVGLSEGSVVINPADDGNQVIPSDLNYRQRPEIQQFDAMEKEAEAALQKAKGASLPTLDGFASYQIEHGFDLDGTGDSWMAGVRGSYTIFDGKRSTTEQTIATIKLQEIRQLRHQTELALNLDLQQAQLELQQADERLRVTEKMVAVAEEAARLSRERFQEGVILASDLIDLETRLGDAQAHHLAAQGGYRVAIANLRRAVGLQQFTDDSQTGAETK